MGPNQNQSTETPNTNSNPQPATPTTPVEIQQDTLMGILCYLGPLVIIPYLTALSNPFVKFHVKQGIVLFGLVIVLYILGSMFLFSGLYQLVMLLNLGTLILTIIGIINVVGKKEVALPLIGQLADKIKI